MFLPRVEKARATLARIEAWQAECARRADEVGLTVAREAEERAGAAARASAKALLRMKPSTLREAAFQAAIIRGDSYDDDGATTRLIGDLLRLACIKLYWVNA